MLEPTAVVTCEADLEQAVGSRPAAIMLKSIRFLDDHCEAFLSHSPGALLGTTSTDGTLKASVLSGAPGQLAPRSDTVLDLGVTPGPDVVDGAPAGLLALVPGYGETLRINGRVRVEGGRCALEVEGAFLHCAKAVMRSELWSATGVQPQPAEDAAPTVEACLAASPFVVLASIDGGGHMDVSPKGDPPGLVRLLDETTIAIADRPGNRRTDTLHNLMDDPRIALLALVPGSTQVAEARGTARVCTDGSLLESMRLRDRRPKAAVVIDVEHLELRAEPTLAAALWDPSQRIAEGTLPRAARIWADHVRRNTDEGASAKVARRLVSEKALAAGVALDYRTNL